MPWQIFFFKLSMNELWNTLHKWLIFWRLCEWMHCWLEAKSFPTKLSECVNKNVYSMLGSHPVFSSGSRARQMESVKLLKSCKLFDYLNILHFLFQGLAEKSTRCTTVRKLGVERISWRYNLLWSKFRDCN